MEENISEPTKEAAKSIHPIHSTTVHKICSGQVLFQKHPLDYIFILTRHFSY